MGAQYRCTNEARRQAILADGTLNGIDHLEVIDGELPDAHAGRQTLLVAYCFLPLPRTFSAANVRLEGGVRITDVAIVWAERLPEAQVDHNADLDSAEDAALDSIETSVDDPRTLLVIRVDQPGDFSTYTLRLVESATSTALAPGFDPVFSQVTFSFKADCPTVLDCQEDEACATTATTPPRIDYLAKDYASFRQLMLDRMATLLPDWEERSPADLGVMLVEALAFTADHLSYYQDAVATEAYLATARKRTSVRRHARLLDYAVGEGCNARAWVAIEVSGTVALPASTALLTALEGQSTVVGTTAYATLVDRDPVVFETLHPATLTAARNAIEIYAWGDTGCCLPKGATSVTIRAATDPLLAEGDVLVIEQVRSPDTGLEADADPALRHVVRLDRAPEEAWDPLTGETLRVLHWHDDDALPFALRVDEVEVDGADEPTVLIRGNVVLADHGRSVTDEAPNPDTVPTSGRYRPYLEEDDLTFAVAYDHDDAVLAAAADATDTTASEAEPQVTLTSAGLSWSPVADLLSSSAFAREFVVEMEEDRRAWIRFGDDELGREPDAGTVFTASYRVGNGTKGNIGHDALAHVVSDTATGLVTSVRNPMAATGGTDPEALADVKKYAPQAFRTLMRAVRPEDYEEIAERHPRVQKASAAVRWTGAWQTVFLAIDPVGGDEVDEDFEAELEAFLEPYRMMGRDLEILPPTYVPLDIQLTVCVKDGYRTSRVLAQLARTFSSEDLSDGSRGFFHPDNFTFGDPVYLSRIVATAMEVPGVDFVYTTDSATTPTRFRVWGRGDEGELAAARIPVSRGEVIRCDSDPNAPEYGRIRFQARGGE